MAYVAIKGGRGAIREAANLLQVLRTRGADKGEAPLDLDAIEHQLHFLHGQVMSEGSLYDPELAALALKQSLGDPLEAAFYLRAFRCTRPRVGPIPIHDTSRMRMIRRISAAFKEIPAGQVLGPTPDYTHRLFNFDLIDESPEAFRQALADWMEDLSPSAELDCMPKVIDFLRAQGLVEDGPPDDEPPFDVSREALVFPLPRSAALSLLSRGHRGALLALAYSNMRGYGSVHPTVAELRVGYLPVEAPHPVTGEPMEVGEVLITECEILAGVKKGENAPPKMTLGYAACFGHDEVKAISMAILDRGLMNGRSNGLQNPSEDQEFVLLHIDGLESMGFCIHYKLPHYVTFQAGLEQLRNVRADHAAQELKKNGAAEPKNGNGYAPELDVNNGAHESAERSEATV